MDALKDLDPQTKMSELTVEQFEGVMTRAFCRVAEYAAVRFAQEQLYAQRTPVSGQATTDVFDNRSEGTRQVREAIAGDDWPHFDLLAVERSEVASDKTHVV